MSTLADRLFVAIQYVLPARAIGAVVHRLARSRRPWLKNALIRAYTRVFAVDEAEMDRARAVDYPSFNAFFTRALRPGARPIDADPQGICSPADGRVQQSGQVSGGRILQVKGTTFSAAGLLGAEPEAVAPFDGGAFLTIYLAPRDYHRVHAPLDGTLRRMHFIPGARFSVNSTTTDAIPGLFARNERLACLFDGGPTPWWLVFVGAMNVASISTVWAGEIAGSREPRREVYDPASAPALAKGDPLGQFNLGSTIIAIFPQGRAVLDPSLAPGRALAVGERIGSLRRTGT